MFMVPISFIFVLSTYSILFIIEFSSIVLTSYSLFEFVFFICVSILMSIVCFLCCFANLFLPFFIQHHHIGLSVALSMIFLRHLTTHRRFACYSWPRIIFYCHRHDFIYALRFALLWLSSFDGLLKIHALTTFCRVGCISIIFCIL